MVVISFPIIYDQNSSLKSDIAAAYARSTEQTSLYREESPDGEGVVLNRQPGERLDEVDDDPFDRVEESRSHRRIHFSHDVADRLDVRRKVNRLKFKRRLTK